MGKGTPREGTEGHGVIGKTRERLLAPDHHVRPQARSEESPITVSAANHHPLIVVSTPLSQVAPRSGPLPA